MKTKLLLGVALLSVGLSVAPPTIVEVEAQTTHVSDQLYAIVIHIIYIIIWK